MARTTTKPPSKASTLPPARETTADAPVITDTMLHTLLRRRKNGQPLHEIRLYLIIPTGKCECRNPGLASIYRALTRKMPGPPRSRRPGPRPVV